MLPGDGGGGPELRPRGAAVELKSLPPEEGENLGHLDLLVHMGDEQNFIYKIWPQQYSVRALPIGRAAEIHLLPAGDLPAGGQSG